MDQKSAQQHCRNFISNTGIIPITNNKLIHALNAAVMKAYSFYI